MRQCSNEALSVSLVGSHYEAFSTLIPLAGVSHGIRSLKYLSPRGFLRPNIICGDHENINQADTEIGSLLRDSK